MKTNRQELTPEEAEPAVGGNIPDGPGYMTVCSHKHKEKTGEEKEDYRYIIFSQHMVEYYCHDCGKKVWIDEDP